jgi:hypothetical protein
LHTLLILRDTHHRNSSPGEHTCTNTAHYYGRSPELGDLGLVQAHTLLDHRLDLGVRVHVMHRVGEKQLAQRPRLVLGQARVERLVLLSRLLCCVAQQCIRRNRLQANENYRTANITVSICGPSPISKTATLNVRQTEQCQRTYSASGRQEACCRSSQLRQKKYDCGNKANRPVHAHHQKQTTARVNKTRYAPLVFQ